MRNEVTIMRNKATIKEKGHSKKAIKKEKGMWWWENVTFNEGTRNQTEWFDGSMIITEGKP